MRSLLVAGTTLKRSAFLISAQSSIRPTFAVSSCSADFLLLSRIYLRRTRPSIMAISLSTEDKLEYQFYPVAHGQVQFRVKAANDAHVALTTGPQETDPMYEVFIGGWGNAKSVIRRNRTKPDVAEVETPDILTADEYRGFWVRWQDNLLSVGKEGESEPFLQYHELEPIGIGYFGVCTGWGATGEWLIEAICIGGYGHCRIPVKTPNDLIYKFHPVRGGAILVDVMAKSNAHISLTQAKAETSPMYEIMLGGWENSASVIRYDRKQPDKVRVDTANLLAGNEYKRFYVSWLDGLITVRRNERTGPIIIEWQDPKHIGISHVGLRTGWGATGHWVLRFEQNTASSPGSKDKHNTKPPTAPPAPTLGDACWCDASGGVVPPGAVEGGIDGGEPLYVARAQHMQDLIPGKLKPSHSVCYVSWGGDEHPKGEYQVLCGCSPTWMPCSDGNIPPNALPGGETESGETLYIGRVNHEDSLTIGKVHPTYNSLFIPYGGKEVAFTEYEILVQ